MPSPSLTSLSRLAALARSSSVPSVPILYRALQVYAIFAPQVAYIATVSVLSHHLGVELWPVSTWLFALPHGYALDEVLRLAVTGSVVAQSVYAWRLSARSRSAGDRRLTLATGWISLSLWALLVTIDGLWDTIGYLIYVTSITHR